MQQNMSRPWNYALAILIVLATFTLQFLFWDYISPLVWFLFYPAVFFAAILTGLEGGILATVISTLLVWYFFLPFRFSFALDKHGGLSAVAFTITGIIFSVYSRRMQTLTQRKAAEEADARLKKVLDEGADAILLTTPEGRLYYANKQAGNLFGYSVAEFLNLSIPDLTPEEDVTATLAAFRKLQRDGSIRYEFNGKRKDGSPVFMEANAIRLLDGNYYAAIRDLTERKKSELEYKTIIQTTQDGFLVVDAHQGQFLDANDAFCKMLGYSREEFLSLKIADIEDMESPEEVIKHNAEIRNAGRAHFETRHRRKDGQVVDVDVSTTHLDIRGGVFIAFIRDITDRKLAEKRLQSSNQLLDSVIHNIPDMIFLKRASDLRFEMFNRAGEVLLGCKSEELMGRNDYDLFPKDQADFFIQKDQEVLDRQGIVDIPEELINTPSGTRILHTKKIALRDEHGQPQHLLGISEDITERKEVEKQLHDLNETLAHRVDEEVRKNMEHERLLIQQSRLAAMGEMIGNIAHQWRQPLNALALMQANVKDDFEYGELNQESMDKFVANGQKIIQKMSSTIDDFRDFFKPQKEKKTFLVHEIVDHTLNIVSADFKSQKIDITAKVDSGIQVTGYSNELSQVLLNVLNNARDTLLDRNVANGKVDIEMEQDERIAWITVRDNAGGIPAEILPKIFDPYFTTKEKGTGIGLYMSKMIMEHMNGAIVASNVGDGAEFKVILPKSLQ